MSPATIVADGQATATATATVTAGGLSVIGDQLTFASSDSGQNLGPVTDNGDGTYTTTVTSSRSVGPATITASDNFSDEPSCQWKRHPDASRAHGQRQPQPRHDCRRRAGHYHRDGDRDERQPAAGRREHLILRR